jgi:hypothetical protein
MSIQYDADASRRASLLVGYIGGYAPSSRLAGRAPRRHPGHSVSGESLSQGARPAVAPPCRPDVVVDVDVSAFVGDMRPSQHRLVAHRALFGATRNPEAPRAPAIAF